MTLYIDTRVNFSEGNVVSTVGAWHTTLPLLAVGSFNQDRGGFVTIFTEYGESLPGCEWPTLLANQVTTLAWHPTRRLLVVGWDGGELYIWSDGAWARLEAPHTASLVTISFSSGGGRLLSCDALGSLAGWRCSTGAPLTSFHHQLGEAVSNVTFLPPLSSNEGTVRGLARAAVAGDETALDALAAWRPRTTARLRETSAPDNMVCYVAQDSGIVLRIDRAGACCEVLNAPGPIKFMSTVGDNLLIVWETAGSLSLTKFIVVDNGSLTSDMHVRMAARNGQGIVMAGGSTVAVVAGEMLVQLWDCETGYNDVIQIEKYTDITSDIISSIAYCKLSDTLCCGTSGGNLLLWRRDHRNQWKLISTSAVKGTVKEINWGSEGLINPLLYVNCITSVFILREQAVCWGYSSDVWMVQKSADEIAIISKINSSASLKTSISVKALAFKEHYLAVADGIKVEVWMNTKESDLTFSKLHSFPWKTDTLLIHEDILVGVVNPHIECKTISGAPLGMLPSSEGEGEPIGITNTNRFVIIATIDGCLKITEITRRGLKMIYPLKNCYQMIEDFGEIMHASVNSMGTYICVSVANAGLNPDPKLYLWNAADDVITNYSVGDGLSSYHCVPMSIIWDADDPRLLIVHMRSAESDTLHQLFCHENKLHEHTNWSQDLNEEVLTDFILCAVCAPHVAVLSQQVIHRFLMLEFTDVGETDDTSTKQTLDFIYNVTIGQLEKAVVIAGRLAGGTSQAIWNGLARSCVTRRRPDVGTVCLSKMGNLKGALMMRKAMEDSEYDDMCKVAILAINLGMLEEAEELFIQAQRPDLVIRITAAKRGGLADIANKACEGKSALFQKNIQHKFAQSLFAEGDIKGAIKMFEKAGTAVPQVPHMLISLGQIDVLAQYVANSKDEDMIRWWGHYLESVGDLDGALDTYARIKDYASQTRLLCHMDRIEEAEKIYHKNDAATFEMARHAEMKANDTEKAVKLYLKCGANAAALRVATEAAAWPLVWRAGNASATHAAVAAGALETAGHTQQAIQLYQKAGKHYMALRLALASGDTSAVVAAAEALGDRVDTELAEQLATRLSAANHHTHAAAILATAGRYSQALDMVERESAPLTEELSARLAPPAGAERREQLLRRLGDVLGARGLYQEAAKRLAQAGDKEGAMRWLLRCGDADRISLFAAASRDRGAQLMAADYLRAHAAWPARPDLARHILHFYTRARAYDRLAAFYAQCATVEIDEYENYDKALEALKEAIRSLGKGADPETGSQVQALQEQSTLVKRYIDVKKMLEAGEIGAGITSGQQLLKSVSGQAGIIKEANVLLLLLQHSMGRPEAKVFQERLDALQSTQQEETGSTDSPEPSIEEVI